MSDRSSWPPGLSEDLARLFSSQGRHESNPSLGGVVTRALSRGELRRLVARSEAAR